MILRATVMPAVAWHVGYVIAIRFLARQTAILFLANDDATASVVSALNIISHKFLLWIAVRWINYIS